MGTEYYLMDKAKHEFFDCGKHTSFYDLVKDLPNLKDDEFAFKYSAMREMGEYFSETWNLGYALQVADALWEFVKNRSPEDVEFVSEHRLFDDDYVCRFPCKLVGSRYFLASKEKIEEELRETTERWMGYHEKWKSKQK